MIRLRTALLGGLVLAALSLSGVARAATAAAADAEAGKVIKGTGISGGLCLILSAADPDIAASLARGSKLYVQVLQPDAKLAAEWGMKFAKSAQRENLSVRESAFDPDHYGSDLFNLILVGNAASLGKAKPADLKRLLVMGGVVAFSYKASAFATAAGKLGMSALTVPGCASAFRKAVKPRPFKPCDSIKWRAGTRAQWSSGWKNHGAASGVFYYTEKLEVAGAPAAGDFLMSVRDQYNGRLLWTMKGTFGLGGTSDGRLFLRRDGKLMVCDARTGGRRQEIAPDGFGKTIRSARAAGKLLILSNHREARAYSGDGKRLWRGVGAQRIAVCADKLFALQNNFLIAVDLKTGKTLWRSPAVPSHGGSVFASARHVHAVSWGNLFVTFDSATGKELWRYKNPAPRGWGGYGQVVGNNFYAIRYGRSKTLKSDLYVNILDVATGKVKSRDVGAKGKCLGYMCAPVVHRAGDYIFYSFNAWVHTRTMKVEYPYLAHPSCFFGAYLADGMVYNFPSRKPGPLQGISAIAPADITFNSHPGGKVFKQYSSAPANGAATRAADWPMFRYSPSRPNATTSEPGAKLVKLWEVHPGVDHKKSFGQLCSIRSGLTQAVSAWGLVIVADMEGQRILALDVKTGKQKWVFGVGSRVEFSPTLYKGLCLFAAKDGFVYCLNAKTGTLCWKRMIPAQVRLIGGQDKLESLWPVRSGVMIDNGVGYACAGLNGSLLGGLRAIAFKPETGALVWSQCYTDKGAGGMFVGGAGHAKTVVMNRSNVNVATGKRGRRAHHSFSGSLRFVDSMDDYLAGGVSLPRNGEDRGGVQLSNGIISGKTIAFDNKLSVAFKGGVSRENWERGYLRFYAKARKGKQNLWEIKDGLIVDDIVLTPGHVYVVGHHYREKKAPELRVLSRKDGKILATHSLNTIYPAWNGMSIAGDRIFIATGEGKLLCYQTAR
jgi:outer membrane protein assembly factor BamB